MPLPGPGRGRGALDGRRAGGGLPRALDPYAPPLADAASHRGHHRGIRGARGAGWPGCGDGRANAGRAALAGKNAELTAANARVSEALGRETAARGEAIDSLYQALLGENPPCGLRARWAIGAR